MDQFAQAAADGRLDADEALAMRRAVFPDGLVTRAEAEALLRLDRSVDERDPAWREAFVEALVDHLLGPVGAPHHVTDEAVGWLRRELDRAGCRRTGLEIALKALERAYSAPDALSALARSFAGEILTAAETISAADVDLVRRTLYASAGAGGVAVTREEADWLFDLEAALADRTQDPAWGDLFVKAVMNCLCGMGPSPTLAREAMLARQSWLEAETPGLAGMASRAFSGGFSGWFAKAKQVFGPSPQQRVLEAHAARLAEAEAQAALTPEEIAWVEARILRDGARTPNERVLLAELGL